MTIDIRSYNQILGEMVRKIIADTPLNDINTGSVLLTLLEAAAQVDFENNASILNVLELLNINATRNSDLDARGADLGLSRITAQRSTGFVTIKDSTITKRSTGLYQVKNPPIAGSTKIFVNDVSTWTNATLSIGIPTPVTGNLFIGRGTANFEGPIAYTSITYQGSFYEISLGAALQKDHLASDVVIDAQGTPDRLISAGTSVFIPSNNQNPSVEFRTLRDAVIPSGEDTVSGVSIVSTLSGSKNNASVNTITLFTSNPFTGATVSNTTALTDGRDVESDDDFRERIKSYANTLARGTKSAILSSVIGISDSDDGKQVSSASITEPPKIGDPSILYIDDGGGFEPSFSGQNVDVLLNQATGNEEFLQLANFPLPRPQVINTTDAPFELKNGSQLRVIVDGVEEAVTFSTSQFRNIALATLSEVIIAINNQSTSFKATFTSDSARILIFPTDVAAELIRVAERKETENISLYANNVFKFPTSDFSYIRLYHNNILLSEQQRSATILSTDFAAWGIINNGTLTISVDGTPPQTRSFDTTDFNNAIFASLSLNDWVAVFNSKFAGITATATSSGKMQLTSNREGSSSTISVVGGSYFNNMFGGQEIEAVGQNSDFKLNRQTGNLRILRDISPDDAITAGTDDAKGSILSNKTLFGNYNVGVDGAGRDASAIIVSDADAVTPRFAVNLIADDQITISIPSANKMRIMTDSLIAFAPSQPHDFIFISNRSSGWLSAANTGLYRITAVGEHTTAGVDTYVEVDNINAVAETVSVVASEDMHVFKSDKYPQRWLGTFTATPLSAPIQDVADAINDNLVNVKASIFKTDAVKISSTTERNGSIAIPVSTGNSSILFATEQGEEVGNPPHVANKVSSKDAFTLFKMTEPTAFNADGINGKKVWMDRVSYSDHYGVLTSNAIPDSTGAATYSEELQAIGSLTGSSVAYDDIFNVLSGGNKGHYRSIRDKIVPDSIGTQQALPRTILNYIQNDRFNLVRPLSISADDSAVFIMDQDSTSKTIDIRMSRTGRITSAFPATNASFSAYDADNEAGVTFSSAQTWGKIGNKTEFKDYAVWFRSRNWYTSGGAGSGGGSLILRAKEYGPHGDKYRFNISYPVLPDSAATTKHSVTPDYALDTYIFGSGGVKPINVSYGDQISVSTSGTDLRYTFLNPATNLSAVIVGDIISIQDNSGVSANNRGQFRIKAVNNILKYVDVYNPSGAVTGAGLAAVSTVTTTNDIIGTKTSSTISNIANAITYNFAIPNAYTFSPLEKVVFTISASSATAGAVYTSGTFTGTVARSVTGSTSLTMMGTNAFTLTSGFLTKVSGTGTATISFSSAAISFINGSPDLVISDTYTNNGNTYTISTNPFNQIIATGSGIPLTSGTLTKTSGTGFEVLSYSAVSIPGAASIGAIYTNNGQTFNIVSNLVIGTPTLVAIGTGAPLASGTLTKTFGSGDATLTFNSFTAVSLNGKYFKLTDSAGPVAVYYTTGSTPTPGSIGVNRIIPVIIAGTESASTVAQLTSGSISADPQFSATYVGTTVTAINEQYGAYNVVVDGAMATSFGFTPSTVGTPVVSLDGKYFKLPSASGAVAFWYDTSGITSEPLHGATRGVRIGSVYSGDSANTVATKSAVVINGDTAFASATVSGPTITATDAIIGARTAPQSGTSLFSVGFTNGSSSGAETIIAPTLVGVFPITGTAVSAIAATVNSSSKLLQATVVDGVNPIVKATKDEEYTPAGLNDYSVSLGYDHDPNNLNLKNTYISLHDGISWVKQFENTSPHFTLKYPLLIHGIAPTSYSLDSAPNHGTADLGEMFKLIPITLNNLYHHFTQKALSQLPIVSDVSISNAIRKVQIKSKQLGSDGAVEMVGGNGNNVEFSIFGDSVVSAGANKNMLAVKTAAFPATITAGDYVRIKNSQPAKRASRLTSNDTISVFKGGIDDVDYRWDHKDTQFSRHVKFNITDQSGLYQRPIGTIWRWEHDESGSQLNIVDKVNGNVTTRPADRETTGNFDAAKLFNDNDNAGTAATKQSFSLLVSDVPDDRDYFTFTARSGATFAVWFDLTGLPGTPSGASFTAATNKIPVDLITPTPATTVNDVMARLTTALINNNAFTTNFTATPTIGANFNNVQVGDLVCAYGVFGTGWSSGNKARNTGDGRVAGLPIINVDSGNRYIDVVNPNGELMTTPTAIGSTASVKVVSTPVIKWNLKHYAPTKIISITVAANSSTATVLTSTEHGIRENDTLDISDNDISQLGIANPALLSIVDATSFIYTTGFPNSTSDPIVYPGGYITKSGSTTSRYAIEPMGFNDLFKIRHIDGNAPGFIDCGAAVDDILNISGNTFKSNNSGLFRILGLTNSFIIFENKQGLEELDTIVPFNNLETPVTWVSNLDEVAGAVGAFKNLSIGDWVKKQEDGETFFVQIVSRNGSSFDDATKIFLGEKYKGDTSISLGVSYDKNSDVSKGVLLQSVDDIKVFEGDSTVIGDTFFVDNLADADWFSNSNAGSFTTTQFGSTLDCRPFVRVKNINGQSQTLRKMSVSSLGLFLLENENDTYTSIRRVEHTAIDTFDENKRQIFMVPATRSYKTSQIYGSKIIPMGKLGYMVDVGVGIDGYLYYTGLMRTVQRTIDGFEPDAVTYPGRRAIGGIVEILTPLIKKVALTLQVTTNEGVNLNDVVNDIKSSIVSYVNSSGVGTDIIMAEVIVRVMDIVGIEAVTVTSTLSTADGRIPIADNERAFIELQDISVS